MPLGRQIHRHYEATHVEVIPMVDCIMVLLIFVMVSSVFVADPGIEVSKPDVGGVEVADSNAMLIAISADDRIFFDGQEIRPDQVAPLVKQAAIGREPSLIIRADKSASHGMFATVFAAGKAAGIRHVEFATARADTP